MFRALNALVKLKFTLFFDKVLMLKSQSFVFRSHQGENLPVFLMKPRGDRLGIMQSVSATSVDLVGCALLMRVGVDDENETLRGCRSTRATPSALSKKRSFTSIFSFATNSAAYASNA